MCAGDAQHEIAEALGLKAVRVSTPTWVDDLYSCTYQYSDGSFTLSVKELSSWNQTYAYFDDLGSRYGKASALGNLGCRVRSAKPTVRWWCARTGRCSPSTSPPALPPRFGVPPTSSSDIAVTVADVILGCWAGD